MELDNVTVRPLSIFFERPWQSGGVSEDWNKANIPPVFKKGHQVHEGELQAGQPCLAIWEEDETCNPRNNFQRHEGQESHSRSSKDLESILVTRTSKDLRKENHASWPESLF